MTEKNQSEESTGSCAVTCFLCFWLLLWIAPGILWISGMAVDEIAVGRANGCDIYCGWEEVTLEGCGLKPFKYTKKQAKIGNVWFDLVLSGGMIYFAGWLALIAVCCKVMKMDKAVLINILVIFVSGVIWLAAVIYYPAQKESCLGKYGKKFNAKVGVSYELILTSCIFNLFFSGVIFCLSYFARGSQQAQSYAPWLANFSETEHKVLLNLMVCMKFGFEFATYENRQNTVGKLRRHQCTGSTAMRDAIKQGVFCMRGLKEVMNKINVLDYKFIHIVLTDGDDNVSNTTLYELTNLSRQMNSVFRQDIETIFIGVNLNNKARNELNQLNQGINGGNCDARVHNCDSMDVGTIFSRIQISLGLKQQTVAVTDGQQGVVVQRNQISVEIDNNTKLLVLFTLDISGSMSGGRWDRVKQAVELFLSRLRNTDLYSVILFNDKVNVITGNPEIMNM